MTNGEAIEFGKEQLEIFGEDSRMSEFIRMSIQALEERPKGKWITHSDYPDRLICPNCNHRYDVWFIDNGTFCPNCGSDNRGDV